MSGIVVIKGVRYKRAVAERLGLLSEEQPKTRADVPASSGLITSRSAAESVPTGETVVPDETPTDATPVASGSALEGEPATDADLAAETEGEKAAGTPDADTATTPKVTKARSSGSTRRG